MLLGNLDNEVYFKKVFTDVEVFKAFVKDVAGIDIDIERVETERELNRKTAHIKFKMDLFAESKDHRVIVEIQKVDYDYNFNRFVHYFISNLAELQATGGGYKFARDVYTIVLITAPYKINDLNGQPIKDDVLLTTLNPSTLNGEVRNMSGHKLIFLNPNYMGSDTPPSILDWMVLIHESMMNPENPQINLSKPAIRKAAKLAEVDDMDPRERYEAANQEARKATLAVVEEMGVEKGINQEKQQRILQALRQGKLSKADIAELFEVSLDFVNEVEAGL